MALTVLLYARVVDHHFLNWDDLPYYVNNPHLQAWTRDNLVWVFSSPADGIWKPLTFLSVMLGQTLFGDAAGPRLLINVGLHAGIAWLVGWLTWGLAGLVPHGRAPLLPSSRSRGLAALLAAALFAIHPMHVEPVAWLSGRKEVLCALFFLLGLGTWLRYLADTTPRWKHLALACHGLALLAKPMAVTFPIVLICLDLYARRPVPLGPLIREKWPFWLLSGAIVPVAIWGQLSVDALPGTDQVGWGVRYAQAVINYPVLLGKLLVPLALSPYYPALTDVPWGLVIAGTLFLAVMGCLLAYDFLHGRRAWFVAGAFYLGVSFPVIGWLQVAGHQMADRYAYLPGTAVCVALAVMLTRLLMATGGWRWLGWAALLVIVTGYGALAYRQVGIWKNDLTLWSHAVRYQPNAEVVLSNLAGALYDHGRAAEAAQVYERALAARRRPRTYRNLVVVYRRQGDWLRMQDAARRGKAAFPGETYFDYAAGEALVRQGRYAEALEPLQAYAAREPDDVAGLWALAYAQAALRRYAAAGETLERLLARAPEHQRAQRLYEEMQRRLAP